MCAGPGYATKTDMGNKPVNYVSWYDVVRFANWLHNGQGTGDTETGAYTLKGGTPTPSNGPNITRNAGATWFLTSQNEWYKGAYYQPAAQGGDSDDYWKYPMGTNSVPYSDQPPGATPDNTRVGNFFASDGLANGYDDGYAVTGSTSRSSSQNYLTDVGAYSSSPSFYGTYDQGGNVWEWNEAAFNAYRGVRGGSWIHPSDSMRASVPFVFTPALPYSLIGFRVASVPEPSTAMLGMIGCVLMLWWSKRRK